MLQREAVPPGVCKEEMGGGTPLRGAAAETGKTGALEKPGGNLDSARWGSHSSGWAHSTGPAELPHPGLSQLSATDAGTSFSSSPLFSIPKSPDAFNSPAEKTGFSGPPRRTSDADCLICCNRYGLSQLPKLLACRHVFCAVCLELLLWNDGQAWTIVCPLCRKATSVLGGLICHLRNEEEALSRGRNGEGPFPSDAPGGKQLACGIPDTGGGGSEDDGSNRMAAKRLLFLVLLLTLLVIVTLPFLYPGLLRWALCIAALWGLAVAGALCWNPKWRCSGPNLSGQCRRAR